MKKVIAFLALALIISVGFAAYNTNRGFTAPQNGNARVLVEFQPGSEPPRPQAGASGFSVPA